jgi:hypothetical protein
VRRGALTTSSGPVTWFTTAAADEVTMHTPRYRPPEPETSDHVRAACSCPWTALCVRGTWYVRRACGSGLVTLSAPAGTAMCDSATLARRAESVAGTLNRVYALTGTARE